MKLINFCFLVLVLSLTGCMPPTATDTPTGEQQSPEITISPESTAASTVAPVTPPGDETPATPDNSTPTVSPEATPEAPTDDQAELVGTRWSLVSFGPVGAETPVADDTTVTLEFEAGGQAGGSAGCNSYGMDYTVEGQRVSFGEITSTLIACADAATMEQEARYLDALAAADSFEQTTDELTIWYDDRQGVLQFVPLSPTPTTESGAQEESAEAGQSLQLTEINMVTAEQGWALGRLQAQQVERIMVTADGGQTWSDRTPAGAIPEATAATEVATLAGYFASVEEAWIAYAHRPAQLPPELRRVWHTEDGGESWSGSEPLDLSDLPFDFFIPSDFGFLDDQFGWFLAHLGAGMSHDYVAVYTTIDRGQSWRRQMDPTTGPELQGCVKTGLLFTSSTTGWLSGDCPGLLSTLFLYQTIDGGTSWTQISLPMPATTPPDAPGNCGIPQLASSAPDHLRLTLRCPDFNQGVSEAWLYTSTDGGQSWQTEPLPESGGTFHFVTPNDGWYLGSGQEQEEAALYHTGDGGHNWTQLSAALPAGTIQFLDAQNGWLVARDMSMGKLWRTHDGGQSWEEIRPALEP